MFKFIIINLFIIFNISLSYGVDFTISVNPTSSSAGNGGFFAKKLYEGTTKIAEIGLLGNEQWFLLSGTYSGFAITELNSTLTDINATSYPKIFLGANAGTGICVFSSSDCSGACHFGIVNDASSPVFINTIFKSQNIYYKIQNTQEIFTTTFIGNSRWTGTSCQTTSTLGGSTTPLTLFNWVTPEQIINSGFPKSSPLILKIEK